MHTEQPVRKVLIFLQQLQDAVFANVEKPTLYLGRMLVQLKIEKKLTSQNNESQTWALKTNFRICRRFFQVWVQTHKF